MKKGALGLVALLVAMNFMLPGAGADDAPAAGPRARSVGPWDTFHGDPGRTGNSSGEGPIYNRVLWSNNTGGNEYSSPVVAAGRVFIGSVDRNLYCFNATTGARLWRHNTGNGIQSSPAVTEDGTRVIVGNVNRVVRCVNVSDGAQAWSTTLDGGIDASPLVLGGNVYMSTTTRSLYCLDAATGAQDWRIADAGGEASPAAEDGRLFSVGSGLLWCFDIATGNHLWNVSVSEFYSSPTASGGFVYLPGGDGSVSCFNASTGSRSWRTATGWPDSTSTAAISNGSVYVCVDSQGGNQGALVKLDASDGRIVWTYQVAGDPYNAPAVAGENVYFSYARTVSCIKASDRSVVWTYQAASADQYGICSSPAIAYGNLYIGGVESKLFCFGLGEPNRPPGAVALEKPENINETAMTLNWSKSADADFARYELHMSKVPGFTILPGTLVQPDGNITDVNTSSLRVKGLEHTTRYFFKLRVWDNGFPPMFNDSNEVDGTTLTPNGAPVAVKLFPAEEVTPFSMLLSWSASNDTDFDRYEVHRSLQKVYAPTGSTLAATIRDADGNSTVVSGLKPWTTYYIKVRVYDNGTPVLYSDSNTLEALTGNTQPFAVALNQPQMGATTADLSWSASADDDFAAYEVHFSQDINFTPSNASRAATLENRLTTDSSVPGLQLARTYHFIVRVVDLGGMFNDSNTVTGLTANTVPKPVISSPSDSDIFDTRTPVEFDGSASSDQDLDPLSFHWVSNVDGFLSSDASFTRVLSEGGHRITLFVNDGHGHNVSARISITVNKAPNRRPAVAVLSPPDNSKVSGVVTFSGTASDMDGNDTLRTVEVKIARSDWEEAEGAGEWSFGWNTTKVQNGKYKVLFRSFDGDLYSAEASLSLTVNNVFVNQKPKVAINPLPSARFSRSAVITGTASDPDGAVSCVEVRVDGGAWQRAFGTRDWSFTLDTTELPNGKHSLQVRAYDGTDHSEEALLDFTVSNEAADAASGPPLMLIGGLLAAVLVAAAAAFVLMRRRKGPEPQSQVVSGDMAAVQQGYMPPEQAAPVAQAPPAYSAFYQQQAGGRSYAQQPAGGAGAAAPMDAEPVTEEPGKTQ